MNAKAEEALKLYEKVYENTRQILDDAGFPPNKIEVFTAKMPRFDQMFPEEVVEIFQGVKRETIIYLHKKGFSYREIARRLIGSSTPIIKAVIDKYKEEENAKTEGTDN